MEYSLSPETTFPRPGKTIVTGLVVIVVVCFAFAAIGSTATASNINEWYTQVKKPDWNPPNWIFGPVWSLLYLMMAVSAWLVWKDNLVSRCKLALGLFAVQLILNSLWSVLFFGMKNIGGAAIEIVALWIAILLTMIAFSRFSKLAAALLVPYLLWVSFASFLNYTIWTLN
jgi:tryptophan-rich sensory protein